MNILIDIEHPACLNFYINSIKILLNQGHKVSVVYLNRGNLGSIVKKELSNFNIPIKCIGKHYKVKIGKYLGIIQRSFLLYAYMRKKNFDVVTSFGFYIGIPARFMHIPSILFHDDYEYTKLFKIIRKFATKFIIPKSIPAKGKNIFKEYDFKELAYLHPKYFKPNKDVLKKYGLKPKKYVFVREVADYSINYDGINTSVKDIIKEIKNLKIVLSLEDKSQKKLYENDCIILEEPVDNFYSLIYYAKFVVSSGDSITREAALLGVKALYTGQRKMAVNKSLEDAGLIVVSKNLSEFEKVKSKPLAKNYIDTTKVIVDNLNRYEA